MPRHRSGRFVGSNSTSRPYASFDACRRFLARSNEGHEVARESARYRRPGKYPSSALKFSTTSSTLPRRPKPAQHLCARVLGKRRRQCSANSKLSPHCPSAWRGRSLRELPSQIGEAFRRPSSIASICQHRHVCQILEPTKLLPLVQGKRAWRAKWQAYARSAVDGSRPLLPPLSFVLPTAAMSRWRSFSRRPPTGAIGQKAAVRW